MFLFGVFLLLVAPVNGQDAPDTATVRSTNPELYINTLPNITANDLKDSSMGRVEIEIGGKKSGAFHYFVPKQLISTGITQLITSQSITTSNPNLELNLRITVLPLMTSDKKKTFRYQFYTVNTADTAISQKIKIINEAPPSTGKIGPENIGLADILYQNTVSAAVVADPRSNWIAPASTPTRYSVWHIQGLKEHGTYGDRTVFTLDSFIKKE